MEGIQRWKDTEHSQHAESEQVAGLAARLLAEARGHQLAEARKRRGLTQVEVAAIMGVSPGRVSQIENGKVTDLGTEVLARYVIRAEDGTMIQVVNQGVRRASPPVIRRLLAGERVDPALVYFRATPTFDAPEGPHRWLTENLFVTAGQRRPDSVEIRFYAVR